MQHLPQLEVMQRMIRSTVCTQCTDRPAGSDHWAPTRERPCQAQCTIFINLPEIRRIVQNTAADTLGPYEKAIGELVCQECDSSPSAGDFCGDRSVRRCPLSRHMNLVIDALERTPQTT